MKKQNKVWIFLCGLLVGVSLSLCLGAAEKTAEPPKHDQAPLQIVSYINGNTGIFDPSSHRIYVYDANLVNCVSIREITTLGAPMARLR